jgi:DNA-binding Xre family transcriptional regulator
MAGKLKNRLFVLLNEKERELGRNIPQAELARELGTTTSTISRWMGNRIERFDAPVVEKMCDYFKCKVGDLLYIDESE